jgi:hypothetical protein
MVRNTNSFQKEVIILNDENKKVIKLVDNKNQRGPSVILKDRGRKVRVEARNDFFQKPKIIKKN